MEEAKKVIGYWSLGLISLNLYAIDYGMNDRALIGFAGQTPEWRKITYIGHESGVKFHGAFYLMSECMRV